MMRTYRVQRGANWYMFFRPVDVARLIEDIQPGEITITIENLTAEQYWRYQPVTNRTPADHLDAPGSTAVGSTDR
jgi:hypothetical protein